VRSRRNGTVRHFRTAAVPDRAPAVHPAGSVAFSVLARTPSDLRADNTLGRHPRDLARLVVMTVVVGLAFLVAGHHRVDPVEAAIYRDAQALPRWLAPVSRYLSLAGSAVGIAGAAGLALLARRARAAIELVVAGTAGWVTAHLVGAVSPHRAVTLSTFEGPGGVEHRDVLHTTFPADHLAVGAVLATVATPYLPRAWRPVPTVVLAALAVAQDWTGHHLALDILTGALIGFGLGSAFHLAWGAPGRAGSITGVARVLRTAGYDPTAVVPIRSGLFGPRNFEVATASGPGLLVEVVRRGQRRAGWPYRIRRLLAALEVEDEPGLSSPTHEVEHEAYVTLLAERAGVRTPAVLLATEIGHGPALLVKERVCGRHLPELAPEEIDDCLLDEILVQVERLGAAHIAHHELTLHNVLVDTDGRPWILDFTFARAGAAPTRLAQDAAEMLVSLTALVGVQRAVDAAERTLPTERLCGALIYLQPLALPATIRQQLDDRRWLLGDLADEVATRLHEPRPSFRPRIRAATVLTLVVAGGAVYLLLPQLGTLPKLLTSIRHATWWWLAAAFLAGLATFPMAAASYRGAVPRRIPWGWTTLTQLASAFTSRLTPGGVGGLGLNVMYLERRGSDRAEALGSVALNQAASVVVHALLFVVSVGVLGLSGVVGHHKLPSGWPVVAGVAGALVLLGLLIGSPFGRQRVLRPGMRVGRDLGRALRRPGQALELFGGAAGVTIGNALALTACLAAFARGLPVLSVVAVYIGGSAIASAAPTPGKLGAVEAALVAGLTGIGVHSSPAVAAVLTFRLITFWIPILPGLASFRYLQHRQMV
jgi:uncharacterized membrane protein YbhN (UPF0104 family)